MTRKLHWLHHKIYPGALSGRMEPFLLQAVPQIAALDGVERLFFLRYTDEGGPHLRLRTAAHGDLAALDALVMPILERTLADLPLLPTSPYRPTIARPAAAGAEGSGPVTPPRIERATYEPDIETFGVKGVLLAEALFDASSRCAIDILRDESGFAYSRKTLVPPLMDALAQAFVPDGGALIWRAYSDYWLDSVGGHAASADWKARFVAKARSLAAEGVEVLPPDAALAPGAVAVLDTWRSACAESAAAFRSVDDDPPRAPHELLFHFLHLMNNRLGLMPIEEAYYATLLAEAVEMEPA